MIIGFTGTRAGLSEVQAATLAVHVGAGSECHQGCCVGADERFAELARDAGCRIVGHPSDIPSMTSRRAVELCDELREPLPPLERNRNIVAACGVLLACPQGMVEEQRSGTWATVRYARRAGKRIVLFFPDGSVWEES